MNDDCVIFLDTLWVGLRNSIKLVHDVHKTSNLLVKVKQPLSERQTIVVRDDIQPVSECLHWLCMHDDDKEIVS